MAVRKLDDEDMDGAAGKAAVSLGELEKSGGFVLRIAQLSAFERFFTVFGESEIRISEFTVLLALSENPGIRQGVPADADKMYRSDREALSMLDDEEHAQLIALSRKIAGWPEVK